MASLMDKFIRDDPIGAIEKIAKEQKMANEQIQPKAAWDKDPTPQAVYYPPPGAPEGIGAAKGLTPVRPQSLSQRINDKINRLQGQIEELQLIRSKLQAGKLDQVTMEDFCRLIEY